MNKQQVYLKERANDMNWNDLENLKSDFFVSKREDDFVITSYLDLIENNSDASENTNKIHDSKSINKSMESKTQERTKAFELSLEKKKSEVFKKLTLDFKIKH